MLYSQAFREVMQFYRLSMPRIKILNLKGIEQHLYSIVQKTECNEISAYFASFLRYFVELFGGFEPPVAVYHMLYKAVLTFQPVDEMRFKNLNKSY